MCGLQSVLPTLSLLLLASSVVVDAGVIYGLSSGRPGSVYTIDSSTGTATKLVDLQGPGISTSLAGFEIMNGVAYATDVFTLINENNVPNFGTIDLATGAFTSLNNQGMDYNWHALAGDPDLNLLYVAANGGAFYNITTAGDMTYVGLTQNGVAGLAFDPVNRVLYGATGSALYIIDPATAGATLVGGFGMTTGGMIGLTYDFERMVLLMNTGWDPNGYRLWEIDTQTGIAFLVGLNGAVGTSGIDGLAFVGQQGAVPEPSGLTLIGMGLLTLAVLRQQLR